MHLPVRPAARRLVVAASLAGILPFAACASPSETATPAASPTAPAPSDAKPYELVQSPLPDDPMGVWIYRLANGTTVMLSENREEPRIDGWMTVRAGSAKDPADATGMAHYLEHMQFKGTSRLGTLDWEREKPHLDEITRLYDELFHATEPEKRDALYARIDAANQEASKYAVASELDKLYDGLGFQGLNAFTSTDQTSYTVSFPSNRLEQWAEVETERLRDPVYRLFQTELEAVYEEKNRGMDNRGRVVFEELMKGMFPTHPYGTQTTIGTVEHLKNPSLTKMYRYFHDWYAPGNIVVALSGDFDPAKAIETVARHFGSLPSRPFPEDPQFPIGRTAGVRRLEVKFKGEEEVRIGFLTVGETHPDRDALVLCDMMLANGRTGLVDVHLNQAQAVKNAGASVVMFPQGGFELLTATPKPGQSLEELETLLLAQVDRLRKGEFSEDDLRAVVTEFEINRKRELESNRARVTAMTESFILRTPWDHHVRQLDRLRALRKSDVVATANRYFGDDYLVVTVKNAEPDLPKVPKPKFTPVKIQSETHTPFFREILAREVPPIEPRFAEKGRDYVEVPLRSGRLVHGKNPMNDVFDLSFSIPFGTDHDPRLSMALSLLDLGGAGDLDGVALKRKLYALGSTISAGAGRDESVVSVTGLESNLEETLALLRKHFETPTGVGQADLDKMVARTIGARQDQKQNPNALFAALTEYARRGAESSFLRQPRNEELSTWKAEDLLAAARDLWRYRRTATYVGKLPPERVAALVDLAPIGREGDADQGFGALVDAPARKPVKYADAGKDRVLFLDAKQAQARIMLLAPDGVFDRREVPAQRVYNEYMSGSMGALVFQEVREARALAYDVGTGYRAAQWKADENLMMGQLGTQADKTVDALTVLFGLIREMPAQAPRFESAIRSIDQAYRTGRLAFRQLPGAAVTWDRQGLEGDPRPWNWEQVRKMTLADLTAFASRFRGKPFTVAIVGPKDRMDLEKLAAFGEVVTMTPDQLFAW